MKLCRVGQVGDEHPALYVGDQRIDVSAFGEDYGEAFFGSGGLARLAAWFKDNGSTCPVVAPTVRHAASITRPSKIICIGLNYRKHAEETGAKVPEEPVVFFKASTALAGPNDDLPLPRGSEKTDWEVELGVVIGKTTRYVDEAHALEHVAGYVLHNDYSERAFQLERGGQWVKGKSADGYAPVGPYVETSADFDPSCVRLWLSVNGEKVQDSNTNDMVFNVQQLVSYLSQFMTLLPGDLISTGTPSGVGLGFNPPRFLKPGDRVEYGIEGLGTAAQNIVPPRDE